MVRRSLLLGMAFALTFGSAHTLNAQEESGKVARQRQQADRRADAILGDFLAKIEGGQSLYDRAAGYAIFRVTKAGFGVSGAGGTGVAVDKTTGKRVYMKMGAGGVGLTFGASRYDVIILFEDAARFGTFATGGWDSAATAQAAAGTQRAGLSSTFFDGVAYFQMHDKGLIASADVTGTRFWVAEDLN